MNSKDELLREQKGYILITNDEGLFNEGNITLVAIEAGAENIVIEDEFYPACNGEADMRKLSQT